MEAGFNEWRTRLTFSSDVLLCTEPKAYIRIVPLHRGPSLLLIFFFPFSFLYGFQSAPMPSSRLNGFRVASVFCLITVTRSCHEHSNSWFPGNCKSSTISNLWLILEKATFFSHWNTFLMVLSITLLIKE